MASSVWRGRITFGLVSIPVRLMKAARRARTQFRRVQRVRSESPPVGDESDFDESPVRPTVLPFPSGEKATPPADFGNGNAAGEVARVRNAPVSALSDQPVQRTEILKGYEVAKDEFVVLAPEEVAAVRPRTSTELEISEFVREDEIDPVYYEASYYVVPEPGAEKAYALLFATLKETRHAGIGSLAMHGREHVALIRAGREALMLHSMFYANEVGQPVYRVSDLVTKPKELELARMLVSALEAKFEPEKWKDRYEERLKTLLKSRAPVPAVGAPQGRHEQAPVADIMAALRKSLEIARKPVASEQQPAKSKRHGGRRK